MSVYDEKNNPPVWFIILGIIIISAAAIFVMLAPTRKYTQENQYYLKNAQTSEIMKPVKIDPAVYLYFNQDNLT